MSSKPSVEVLKLTAELVRAFVQRNPLPATELPALIHTVYDCLARLGAAPVPIPETLVGAVSLRKSLSSPDHIISMIDGKPYRILKMHLGSHGLSPAAYRTLYKLPDNYPMVAPTHAAQRSALAKKNGLGRKQPILPSPAPTRRKLKIAGPKGD